MRDIYCNALSRHRPIFYIHIYKYLENLVGHITPWTDSWTAVLTVSLRGVLYTLVKPHHRSPVQLACQPSPGRQAEIRLLLAHGPVAGCQLAAAEGCCGTPWGVKLVQCVPVPLFISLSASHYPPSCVAGDWCISRQLRCPSRRTESHLSQLKRRWGMVSIWNSRTASGRGDWLC